MGLQREEMKDSVNFFLNPKLLLDCTGGTHIYWLGNFAFPFAVNSKLVCIVLYFTKRAKLLTSMFKARRVKDRRPVRQIDQV